MNRLANETSPYLQLHKDNPVDWYPWGPEALAAAEAQNKPILLSIGYTACHWCHVMEQESFADPATAALMNEHFINIKVDREERPDIDQIYQVAGNLMGHAGGWPLTAFLTPQRGRLSPAPTPQGRARRPAPFQNVMRDVVRLAEAGALPPRPRRDARTHQSVARDMRNRSTGTVDSAAVRTRKRSICSMAA